MKKHLSAPLAKRAISGALAGIIGGVAHAAMNEVDRKVLNYNADDFVLLGGVLTKDTQLARRVGLGMHLSVSAVFGATYGVVLHPKNEDDAMKKAVGFAMVENFGLFPLGIFVDRYHPHVKSGTSDRFFTPTSLVEATLRHIVLGVGMGASYPGILKRIRG